MLMPLVLVAAPVSTDIAARLARWKPVEMPYDAKGLDSASGKWSRNWLTLRG